MMKSDPYLARIESFNLKNGGGVNIKKVQNGYNLYLFSVTVDGYSDIAQRHRKISDNAQRH